jgi:MFS family permease
MTMALNPRELARWRNAIITIFLLGGLTLSTWGPRLPSIRSDLRLDDGGVGLLVAGATVGSIAGLGASSAILAWLGPRRGIGLTFVFTSVGICIVGFGAGTFHSVAIAEIGFVSVGFGIGAVDVMMNVEGSAVERAAKKTLMPLMHAAWSAGAVVGSGIGAGCAALGITPQWQFLAIGVIVAATAAIATRFIPVTVEVEEAAKPPIRQRVTAWLRGWTDWRLLLIGVVMLGVELGEGSANNWLTLSVHDEHHQADSIAALFFTVFAVSETLARVFGGPLVDRVGRVWAVRFTTAIGVVGLVMFILGGPIWLVLLGTLFWAVGVSMGFPLGMSAAAESGPNPAARVSVVASLGYLANLAGPPVVGFLAQSFGLLNALWLVIALLVLAFLAAGSLRTRSVPSKVNVKAD